MSTQYSEVVINAPFLLVKGFLMGQEDPIDDLADTFKALLTMMTVVLGVWIVCLLIWGK